MSERGCGTRVAIRVQGLQPNRLLRVKPIGPLSATLLAGVLGAAGRIGCGGRRSREYRSNWFSGSGGLILIEEG
jgi:hypothetical protein